MNTAIKNKIYLILFLFLFTFLLGSKYYPNLTIEILKPIFFFVFFFYLLYMERKNFIPLKTKNKSYLLFLILLSITLYSLFFLLFDVAKNPYFLKNKWFLFRFLENLFPVLCIEKLRFLLIKEKEKNKKKMLFLTLFLPLLELNYTWIFANIWDKKEFFHYFSAIILSQYATSFLLTYFRYHGTNGVVLRITILILSRLIPIIPNIHWFIEGTMGLFIPFLYYVLFPSPRQKKEKMAYYGIGISLLLIFFMLGLLPLKPIAIVSNSMANVFSKGDIVLYSNYQSLHVNDIIVFQSQNKIMVHRIVNIKEQNGKNFYQTKGDQNKTTDNVLVTEEQILGIYRFHIKYIGYPAIVFQNFLESEVSS